MDGFKTIGRRGGETAVDPVDREQRIYLPSEPLRDLIEGAYQTYGEDATRSTIRDALVRRSVRAGSAPGYSSFYRLLLQLEQRQLVELDIVDAIYCALNRPDLFRMDYFELYSE